MRHGNVYPRLLVRLHSDNSYPTYEAWKLNKSSLDTKNELTPILPMRHGNKGTNTAGDSFNCTPILPMRHGNAVEQRVWMEIQITPILPMRHGNFF